MTLDQETPFKKYTYDTAHPDVHEWMERKLAAIETVADALLMTAALSEFITIKPDALQKIAKRLHWIIREEMPIIEDDREGY